MNGSTVARINDLAYAVAGALNQPHRASNIDYRITRVAEAIISEARAERPFEIAISDMAAALAAEEKAHGWPDRTFGDDIALFHSELSEALEEYRNGHRLTETYYNPEKPDKPEGIPIEIADCVIRIMAFCGKHGIDLGEAIKVKHAYNRTREIRHGGKLL